MKKNIIGAIVVTAAFAAGAVCRPYINKGIEAIKAKLPKKDKQDDAEEATEPAEQPAAEEEKK